MLEIRVCFYGDYDPLYIRNRVLIKGLKLNKVELFLCNKPQTTFKLRPLSILRSIILQIKIYIKLFKCEYDVLFIGFPVIRSIWLPKLIKRKTILIIDPLFSYYNLLIDDHKFFKRNSVISKLIFKLDILIFKTGDLILTDTISHLKYFSKLFNIPRSKFINIYVGADSKIYYPLTDTRKKKKFTVTFLGSFIPAQGVEYIVEAAKILESNENIIFELVGGLHNNPIFKKIYNRKIKENITNIKLTPKIHYKRVPNIIQKSDIQLGIFGKSSKAQLVIPGKAYEAIAMKKPLITGDTLAIKELFINNENCMLVDIENPKDLAEKVLLLYNNPVLRRTISEKGYQTYTHYCSPLALGKKLKSKLEEIIK
ncbi:MAG: glycosyltransferase [Candidatus Thorarchaeota archaeon]